jgi:hypothetical protein
VQVVVAVEPLQPLDQRERGAGVARLGDRGGMVERDDRRAGTARELAVERRDLLPVLLVVGVQRRERCVQHVLVAARVAHEHQREQAVDLRLVGHQLGQRASEPDRLRGELPAAAVALVEDQVHDREHRREAVGQQVRRRDAERDPGVADLALRAYEPLGHRRLGHEERARDLLRGQPAERAQRQRDLCVERERRMAAREQQLEPLVGDRRLEVHVAASNTR